MTRAFEVQVVRDTQIDCALAELYHQGKATSQLVNNARQAEAMQAVFTRLNEMEDMLTLAQKVGPTWFVGGFECLDCV